MREDGMIDYVELPGMKLPDTKRFYGDAFGWTFVDYGPDYAAFTAGVDGGFNGHAGTESGGQRPAPLVIVYAKDLEAMEAKVRAAGGQILAPIYSFPGGRRFHFQDPSGNELAVWSEG